MNEGLSVTLDGSGSTDSDGDIISYKWAQTAGPLWPVGNRDSASVALIAPDVSIITEYRFLLTVEDDAGAQASDEIIVTVEPSFQVKTIFPSQDVSYLGDEITITGRVENYTGSLNEVNITVESGDNNYTPAIDNSGFWRANDIALSSQNGFAFINVSAVDGDGNTSSYQLRLDTQPSIVDGEQLLYNASGNLLYTYSDVQRAFISIDLASGRRTEVSGSRGSGVDFPTFLVEAGIFLDTNTPENNTLYMLGLYGLVKADVASGDRAYLPYSFDRAAEFAIDSSGEEAFVADGAFIYGLSTVSDSSRVIASAEAGEGPVLAAIESLDYHPGNNSLYAIDSTLNALVAINLETLEREIIADNTNEAGIQFYRNEAPSFIDQSNNTLYVMEGGALYRVSLVDGEVNIVLRHNTPAIASFPSYRSMAHNIGDGSIFFLSPSGQKILSYELATGQSENLLHLRYGSGDHFNACYYLHYDTVTQNLLAGHASSEGYSLAQISPATGSKNIFPPASGYQIEGIARLDNQFLLSSGSQVLLHSLYTGNTTLVSGMKRGDGPGISGGAVAISSVGNSALVLGYEEIMEVDIESGNRELTYSLPENSIAYLYDSSTNAILGYTHEGDSALFSINAETWLSSTLYNTGSPRPAAIKIKSENELHTVTGGGYYYQPSLNIVNTETQNQSIISNHATGRGPIFIHPREVVVDQPNQRAFISNFNQLFAVDLVSGDRAVIANCN